jgi:hypothetical protein
VFKAHREVSPFEEATTLCTGITAAALAIPMEHNAATSNQISPTFAVAMNFQVKPGGSPR